MELGHWCRLIWDSHYLKILLTPYGKNWCSSYKRNRGVKLQISPSAAELAALPTQSNWTTQLSVWVLFSLLPIFFWDWYDYWRLEGWRNFILISADVSAHGLNSVVYWPHGWRHFMVGQRHRAQPIQSSNAMLVHSRQAYHLHGCAGFWRLRSALVKCVSSPIIFGTESFSQILDATSSFPFSFWTEELELGSTSLCTQTVIPRLYWSALMAHWNLLMAAFEWVIWPTRHLPFKTTLFQPPGHVADDIAILLSLCRMN